MLQGAASFQQVATPTRGLVDLFLAHAHGIKVGPVRGGPGGPFGHVAAWQVGLVHFALQHGVVPSMRFRKGLNPRTRAEQARLPVPAPGP